MKNLLMPAVLLAVLTFAGCKGRSDVPVHEGPAEIAFKGYDTEYDFGTFERTKEPSHTFRFYNTGSEPLVVHDVETSCGCVTVEWTRTPVAPGESGTIKATFRRGYMSAGSFSKSLTVHSNASNGDFTVYVRGTVVRTKMKQRDRR